MATEPITITQFFAWLVTASGAAAAASFILERIPAFQAWVSPYKSYIILVVMLGIGLIAYAAMTYMPADMLAQLEPWFKIVALIVGAWVSSQVAHTVDPKRIQAAEDKTPTPTDAPKA